MAFFTFITRELRFWQFPVFILLFVVISSMSAWYIVWRIDQSSQNSLIKRAQTISQTLDASDILSLSGSLDDIQNPAYARIKEKLTNILSVNTDLSGIYLAGRKNGKIFFFTDATKDPVKALMPGTPYQGQSVNFYSAFIEGTSAIDDPTSENRLQVLAFSPIRESSNGPVIAVMEIAVPAFAYYQTLLIFIIAQMVLLLLLVTVSLFIYAIHKKEEDVIIFKSQLASIAAHDLRTPLAGISWCVSSMLLPENQHNLALEQKEKLVAIGKSVKILLQTVNTILETSLLDAKKQASLVMVNCNLAVLLQEVVDVFTLSIKEKSLLVNNNANTSKELFADCDPVKIKLVFSNLLSNAIKYSLDGGVVTIACQENANSFIISFNNQGPVIQEHERKKLFRQFYRAKGITQTIYGTGLGLYYIKKTMEAHHGRVWFESNQIQGTTFFIELPK